MSYIEEIRQFYLRYDENQRYHQKWGYENPVAADYWNIRREIILKKIDQLSFQLPHSPKILELGSGFGVELEKFNPNTSSLPLKVGVEIDYSRCIVAQKTYQPCHFFCGDIQNLAFKEGQFDIVMQYTCVFHHSDPKMREKIYQEIHRVLKPGGLLIWWDMTRISPFTYLGLEFFTQIGKKGRLSALKKFLGTSTTLILNPRKIQLSIDELYSHLLSSISQSELRGAFPSYEGTLCGMGTHFEIWRFFWKRRPGIAKWFFKHGFFYQHLLGLLQKPKP